MARYKETVHPLVRPDDKANEVFAMLRYSVLLLTLLIAGAARAEDERGSDLVGALKLRVERAVKAVRPSIACILVSRSEAYRKAPYWGVQTDPEKEALLGRFDAAAAARSVPTSAPHRARILRTIAQHDLSDPTTVPESYGSGFVIDRSGLILTSAHVVRHATKIYVRLPDKRGSWADLQACDPRSDLAVLKLLDPPADLKPVPLGDGSAIRTGQFVISIANGFTAGFRQSDDPTVGWGLVSKLRQRLDPAKNLNEMERHKITLHHYGTLIRTDAQTTPGCSGGALLDLDGKVIGLTTALAGIRGNQPGGFAIPIDASTRRIIEVLKKGEEVEYGFLGVVLHNDSRFGVRIYRVTPGSPASRGGIMPNDQIVSVNGHPIRENDDLFLYVSMALAGTTARIEVSRGGGLTQTRTVKLAKFYVPGKVIAAKRPPARFGLRVDYTSILTQRNPFPNFNRSMPDGVVVREVIGNSAADRALLQPDKVITQVNGRPVHSPAEFNEAIARTGKKVELTFLTSDGRSERLTLEEK
jgi:serine protease Do